MRRVWRVLSLLMLVLAVVMAVTVVVDLVLREWRLAAVDAGLLAGTLAGWRLFARWGKQKAEVVSASHPRVPRPPT